MSSSTLFPENSTITQYFMIEHDSSFNRHTKSLVRDSQHCLATILSTMTAVTKLLVVSVHRLHKWHDFVFCEYDV